MESEGRRLIRENDPTCERGWEHMRFVSLPPWLVGVPTLAGAAYYGYRRWMGGETSA